METIKQLSTRTTIPVTLLLAVVRQCGGWNEFTEMADDVTNHGADSGFSGFTYCRDTEAFTKAHKQDILQMAGSMANDFGSESIYALIAGFNCLKLRPDEVAEAIHNPRSELRTTVYNALAWFALEEVSRAYSAATETA